MSKLLQRLSDATKSGVYRAPHARDIEQAARGSALAVVRIPLAGASAKGAVLERIAAALTFPDWFGGNWDALEDCLGDLSWMPASGHVLLFEDSAQVARDERGILVDILASTAAERSARGRPFFAVFLGDDPALPALYRASG